MQWKYCHKLGLVCKNVILCCFVGDLGAVVLGRYAQRKLLEYQDKEAAEYLTHFRFCSVFTDTVVVVTVIRMANGL